MSKRGKKNRLPDNRGPRKTGDAPLAAPSRSTGASPPASRQAYGVPRDPPIWFTSGWLCVALIAVATLAAYSNTLHSPFIFDDVNDIVRNTSIRHLWPPWGVFVVHAAGKAVLQTRPLATLTLAINYAMGGLETFPYHLTNVAVHLLAGLTLFGVVRRTLVLPGLAERLGHAATSLALAVALLWTLHPMQTHAVTYLTQRYESMMGLFYLLALYSLIRCATSPRRRAWETAAVAATLAALGCKEVAVSAPLCLLFYDRAFLAGSFREAWARRRWMYVGLASVWAAFAVAQTYSGSRAAWAGYSLPVTWAEYARTQFGVILHYLRLSFWPHPLVLDYGWQVARSAGEILPGLVVVGGLAVATGLALVRRPKLGFLGASFFLILAPTSSIMPVVDLAFIHRMYLPLATIVTAVVLGGHLLGEAIVRRGWLSGRSAAIVRGTVVMAVAASMTVATWERNADFSSALSIWTDTVAKAPHNPRAHNALGLRLVDDRRIDEAIAHFHKALEIKPDFAEALSNLGIALASGGRAEEAVARYQRALEIKPDFAEAHYNLANILAARGQLDEAVSHYGKALDINPDYAEAHNNLGAALAARGRTDEAIAHYRKALDINPDYAEAHNNLGAALAARGRTDEAITRYRKALVVNPAYAEAHNNLGVALAARGQTDEAIAHYRTTLSIKPDHAKAHNNLGIALAARGQTDEAVAQYRMALDLAVKQGKQAVAEEVRRRLATHDAGMPSGR